MKNKIKKFNKIYLPAMKNINLTSELLNKNKIKHKLGFFSNHEVKVGKNFVKELYPIPVISCKINSIEVDIGFDIATSVNYIGFFELTLNKNDILQLEFEKILTYNFEVYGYKNCFEDYYFGDLTQTKELISKSPEKKFHVGLKIENSNQVHTILSDVFQIIKQKS